jgi:hypothetical protein
VLWAWIRDFQLPTASPLVDGTESLWVNFFEDRTQVGSWEGIRSASYLQAAGTAIEPLCGVQTNETNRNSWAALELARYLIEARGIGFDPDWRAHVDALLDYALTLFSEQSGVGNTTLMGEQVRVILNDTSVFESATVPAVRQQSLALVSIALIDYYTQDDDRKPWGGASSKLGAIAALYACAGGPAWYGPMGLRNAGESPPVLCTLNHSTQALTLCCNPKNALCSPYGLLYRPCRWLP